MTKAYRDTMRERVTTNANLFPTRTISYTSSTTWVPIELEALVGDNSFNSNLPDDKKTNTISCKNLKLTIEPTKTDTLEYDGKTYFVRDFDKLGTLYSVTAENAKRNKVTSRKFAT